MIKVINLAIALSLISVTAASAEVGKASIVDPALSKALETLNGTYNNKTYKKVVRRQVVAGKPKAAKRAHKDLDKVLILGGAEAFPM
ncbi:MAG: hypothetical protein K2Y22_01390 [Candidatus Obscuribacterales bacterium]|nr:hypothetical protein [Candidatus Obscuribacterales bacterium]